MEKICYNLLERVFILGEYSSIALNDALNSIEDKKRAYVTKVFYGVLEKSIQFDYIIKELTTSLPQKKVQIILKIGLYLIRYTNTPAFAAINKTVELTKSTSKRALSGFVNAFLRKSLDYKIDESNLSVFLSYPQFVIKKLSAYYDREFIIELLSPLKTDLTHVRINENKIERQEFEQLIKPFSASPLGYYLNANQIRRLKDDQYTIQSLSSMLAVKAYLSQNNAFLNVLDLCAAPGGKSIYLKQLCPNANITACDLHPHRVELIKKYATRMGVQLNYLVLDSLFINQAFIDKFDLVICDVPCSGLGVKGKPDILINKKEEDIEELNKTQLSILTNASKYLKKDGILCYSTCTILKEENESIIEKFLSNNKNFSLTEIKDDLFNKNDGMINLYSHQINSDSFFIARLKKAY